MTEPRRSAPVTYWDYLRIDELLALQGGVERDEAAISSHEMLFVVVHQVFELWFKVTVRELTFVRDVLAADPVPDQQMSLAVHALRRAQTVMEVGAHHWGLMETLSTRDFLDFREKLVPASGFQSGQFREIEAILGLDEADRIGFGGRGAHEKALLTAAGERTGSKERLDSLRATGRSIRECLDDWLWRTPIRGSSPASAGDADVIRAFASDYVAAMERDAGDLEARAARQTDDADARKALVGRYRAELDQARAWLTGADAPAGESPRRMRIRAAIVFLESYRELPLLAWPRELLDAFVAFEQSMLIFRQRHARMVEREIGRRIGTGGSAGVAYLDETALRYRVFKDLWAARTMLLRRDAIPPLEQASFYDFRFGG